MTSCSSTAASRLKGEMATAAAEADGAGGEAEEEEG
jgi:hypothetical protein